MINSSVQNDIINLEKQYWNAMAKNDIDAGVALTRFPCIVSGPMGSKRISEDQYRAMMKSNNPDQYKGIELSDAQVELINDKTALISYSTKVNGMQMLDVSTWIQEGDKWLCAFHSENPQKI